MPTLLVAAAGGSRSVPGQVPGGLMSVRAAASPSSGAPRPAPPPSATTKGQGRTTRTFLGARAMNSNPTDLGGQGRDPVGFLEAAPEDVRGERRLASSRSNIIWTPEGHFTRPRPAKQSRQRQKDAGSPVPQPSSPSARRTPLTGELKCAWGPPEIWKALQGRGSELNALNVSFALNRLAKVVRKGGVEEGTPGGMAVAVLEQRLVEDMHNFSARSLVTALHSLTKLRRKCPEAYEVGQRRSLHVAADFTPQGLSNLLWAYANAGHPAPALFDALAPQVLRLAPTLGPSQVSTVLWAYTVTSNRRKAVFLALQQQAVRTAHKMRPQDLTAVAWALSSGRGYCHASDHELYHVIEEEAVRREGQFAPHGLVRLVRSFASAGQPAPKLLSVVEQSVISRPANFSSQELACLARACGMMGHRSLPLFTALGQETVLRGESFGARELASMARAAANLGHHVPELFAAVEQVLLAGPGATGTQELAMICRAFAILGLPSTPLYAAVEQQVANRGQEFKPQEFASICWSFAQVVHQPGKTFHSAVAASLQQFAGNYKPQELSNVVWALAVLDVECVEVLTLVEQEVVRRPQQFLAQDLANISWAFSKAGRESPDLVSVLEERIPFVASDFTPQGLACVAAALPRLSSSASAQRILTLLTPKMAAAASMGAFTSQGLALVARGYASQRLFPAKLFAPMTHEVIRLSEDLSCEGRRRCILAFGAASNSGDYSGVLTHLTQQLVPLASTTSSRDLMKAIRCVSRIAPAAGPTAVDTTKALAQELLLRANVGDPVELALAARALSTMGRHRDHHQRSIVQDLLLSLQPQLVGKMGQLQPRNIAMVARAYSERAIIASELFDAIGQQAAVCANAFEPHEFSSILESFRRVGHNCPAMFAAFGGRLAGAPGAAPLGQLHGRDLILTIRAFAMLGHGSPAIAVALENRFLDHLESPELQLSSADAVEIARSMKMLGGLEQVEASADDDSG